MATIIVIAACFIVARHMLMKAYFKGYDNGKSDKTEESVEKIINENKD